jgi:hypothetical protein
MRNKHFFPIICAFGLLLLIVSAANTTNTTNATTTTTTTTTMTTSTVNASSYCNETTCVCGAAFNDNVTYLTVSASIYSYIYALSL